MALVFIFLVPIKYIYALEESSSDDEYIEDISVVTISDIEKEGIFITEFYPNPNNEELEWVEIYNSNDTSVELVDWFIDDTVEGGSKAIPFTINIPANSYIVIELSKSILNNSGSDSVSLLDENSFPLHVVNYSKTVQGSSIQKVQNLGWVITQQNTKGKENLTFIPSSETKPTTQKNSSLDDIYALSLNSLSVSEKENIYITEFCPNPIDGKEWVELYNNNDHSVDLIDWKIDDTVEKGGTPVSFSTNINKKSYKVIEINKSLLNNSSDKVTLIDELNNNLHIVSYSSSPKGGSIQKIEGKWYITQHSTKGEKNLELKVVENPLTKNEELQNLSTTNTANQSTGEVLGAKIEYRTIPIYDMTGEKYLDFQEPKGKVYVVTEKELPNSYEKLVKFFSKAFW